MIPFLKQVARVYFDNEHDKMLDYCFVFPNKRSGIFFADHLANIAGSDKFIFPQVTTISDFVSSLSPLVEATRYEQLFTLYNEYHKLSSDLSDFDKFQFWGELLLSDFNDVDRYLVDADQLFVNVKRLKEISANYFTSEQVEIIKRYWGELPNGYDPDSFWSHIDNDGNGKASDKFLKLWEVLLPLYNNFKASLRNASLSSNGMFYRDAVDKLSSISIGELPYRRYIFVGFNVLSISEISIFEKLKSLGVADFYWDFNSPAFKLTGNRASRFLSKNVSMFPSRYDLNEPEIDRLPKIEIIGVPSETGQVKMVGKMLGDWVGDKTIDKPDNAVNTAIVLPDENLFIPMLHSIPDSISSINVTMGFPMRHTSIATLMRNIVSMHLRARSIKGNFKYYYEDLKQILTHPLVNSMAPVEASALLDHLVNNRLFTIDYETIVSIAPSLETVFTVVSDIKDIDKVADYTRHLLAALMDSIGDDSRNKVELYFLQCYLSAVDNLCQTAHRYHISMNDSTFFHLLERAVGSETINFTGKPLKGLQVMGVLETRALDFDNVIMLSMNERIFPSRHFSRSFIPDALRKAYGMSTLDYQESIYAYYFYRLIARAKKVVLLYNASAIGGKSGEISRYLAQLLYMELDNSNVAHRIAIYGQNAFNPPAIEISKNKRIMGLLERYKTPGSGKNLSASSINDYINCPVNFYLKHVEGYNPKDDLVDYMDSATYGTILHEVAENLYKSLAPANSSKPIVVTDNRLKSLYENKILIEKLVTCSINKHFNKLGDNNTTPLEGSELLLGRVMVMFIREMLKRETPFTPFEFIEAEMKLENMQYKVNDTLSINIKQIIDRVDRINIDSADGGTLRIVDYKTGNDEMKAVDVDRLFDNQLDRRPKAILQLMFYCNAYSSATGFDGPIMPFIYKFSDIKVDGLRPLKVCQNELTDYRSINDEFLVRFNKLIEEIFDPTVPFIRSTNEHSCKYCKFKTICAVRDS